MTHVVDAQFSGPPLAPPSSLLSADHPYEARVWLGKSQDTNRHRWLTVDWCASKEEAESAVVEWIKTYRCQYGQVCGPSPRPGGVSGQISLLTFQLAGEWPDDDE